ncbi:hemolysin-type calcium binding protein related domain protein [compost metagenome]
MRLNGAASPWGADVAASGLAASGLAASDIVASRRGDDLLLEVRGSAETVTIHDYFRKNAAGGYVADEVRFADGRLWQLRPGCSAAPVL